MKAKIAIAGALLGLVMFSSSVFAQGHTPSPFPTPRRSALTQSALRSCEARQDAVKNRMTSLTSLAANIEKVFDSIATRVEDFYTNKVLPSGKSLSNYDALVADISAKKGMVDTDLDAAQAKVDAFSCTADDPRGLLTEFRLDMQKVKTDLKNYRTAIKNLIVAARPLAPEASPEPEKTEKPETPEPTASPEV